VGNDTLNLTANNNADTGAITLVEGTILVNGANGTLTAGAITVDGGPVTVGAGASGKPFNSIPSNTLQFDYTGLSSSVSRTDGHSVTLDGGLFSLTITSGTLAENENFGATGLSLSNGFNLISLTPNSTSSIETSNSTAIANANGGTGLVQGNNLGVNAVGTAGSTNMLFTGTPTFIGQTAQTANAQNTGILPWLVVDNSSNGTGGTYSFATYNANASATGLQALGATDYNSASTTTSSGNLISANVTNNNLLFTSAQTLAARLFPIR